MMPTKSSITFRVRTRKQDDLLFAKGECRRRLELQELIPAKDIPLSDYMVTWTVGKGKYRIDDVGFLHRLGTKFKLAFCVFPFDWYNVRVERTVKVL